MFRPVSDYPKKFTWSEGKTSKALPTEQSLQLASKAKQSQHPDRILFVRGITRASSERTDAAAGPHVLYPPTPHSGQYGQNKN